MSEYPKRLIEVDLPIKRISEHARREKSIRHGHISTLHIWWARRPLAACRAVICAALWPDPVDDNCPQAFRDAAAKALCNFAEQVRSDAKLAQLSAASWTRWNRTTPATLKPDNPACWADMRYALLDFIADFANWDASTIPAFLDTARLLTQAAHEALGGVPGTRPLVVDPFAGGGSIPLEALRVGADAFASDLNPVAVLLNKVVLEYIPKYGQRLADEVRQWGQWVKEQAEKELAQFYPKDPDGATPIAYLWARTIRCEGPGCGADIPLMRSLWLAKKNRRAVALRLTPDLKAMRVDFEIVENAKPKDVGEGTVRRGAASCPVCGYTTPVASVRRQLRKRRGGTKDARLLAVVTTRPGQQGRFYRLPTSVDLEAVQQAVKELERRRRIHKGTLSLIPDEQFTGLEPRRIPLPQYGMLGFGDLFTDRQALALTTLTRLIGEIPAQLAQDYESELAVVVRTCVGLVVSRQADYTSALCSWHLTGEKVNHTFARQALPMVWDFTEVFPFSGSSGDFGGALEWVLRVCQENQAFSHLGHVLQASATAHPLPDDAANAFVTDPPYYYSVPYADLSDYFYVWLHRSLEGTHKDLFEGELTPKAEECIQNLPHSEVASLQKSRQFYEEAMFQALSEGRRVTKPEAVGTVVFAHTETAAWEALLGALINAGWYVTASWPIDTEMTSRVIAQRQSTLGSSIHLVCRPRERPDGSVYIDFAGDWRDVLAELPRRIHDWMPRLAAEGVVGADAIFACLGPALEIYSRYSRVEKANGEQVTLKEYLEYVWAAVAKEALSMIFEGADATGFEEDARITAMWLWTLGTGNQVNSDAEDNSEDENDENAESPGRSARTSGYVLEYDAARKIAQGLGADLSRLSSVADVKGDKARLLSVAERARYLFGEDAGQAPTRRTRKSKQLTFFEGSLEAQAEEEHWGALHFPPGATTLDRVHQTMLLFAAGRSEALRRFLVEEGVGRDQRFWRLAQALSALYPSGSEEKRWVDGVLARKKGLGF